MIINILLAILIVIIIYALLIIILAYIDSDTNNADYLIVLGHKLHNDLPNEVLKYRLRGALKYADNNMNTKIVLSGGKTKGNTISEASVMKEYLIKNGIDSRRIILEDKSTDTVENISNCKTYIDINSKVVLLSSNYHIVRSKMICRLLGLKVKGIGVFTPIISLIKHIAIEELFIFIHYFRIKNKGA